MPENIFRKVQEQLDRYSIGFPATTSGIEIQILKELFTENDAEMFLQLTPALETPESIAQRLNKPVKEVAAQLKDMSECGLLYHVRKGDSYEYGVIAFVHGLFEFQVKRLGQKLAQMMDQYINEKFQHTLNEGIDTFFRTVPIQNALDISFNIAPYDDACEVIRNSPEPIIVADCICRKQKELIDHKCEKPREGCIMFGDMAQFYLDHNMARQVDSDEAIQILTGFQKVGLVTQMGTAQNPGGMCNCCGDCCGFLESLNKQSKPSEMVFSNYYAAVNPDACTGCETCLDRCQMGALGMNQEETMEVNLDRCIGCGLCVTTCPEESIQLFIKPEDKRRIPPVDGIEQMMLMAKKRGIQL